MHTHTHAGEERSAVCLCVCMCVRCVCVLCMCCYTQKGELFLPLSLPSSPPPPPTPPSSPSLSLPLLPATFAMLSTGSISRAPTSLLSHTELTHEPMKAAPSVSLTFQADFRAPLQPRTSAKFTAGFFRAHGSFSCSGGGSGAVACARHSADDLKPACSLGLLTA